MKTSDPIRPARADGLNERVHLIPLGHEIDRAVKPFNTYRAERAYVIVVPDNADLDEQMLEKQRHYTKRVCEGLLAAGVRPEVAYCNMFDILDVLRVVSSLIVREKRQGNDVLINMSACGRMTSVAVTMAAMVHGVRAYYVHADRYATGDDAALEADHGLSIVETGQVEPLYNFSIMMPDAECQLLLCELYRRGEGMTSEDLFGFFHKQGFEGYDELPPEKRNKSGEYSSGPKNRELLNRMNRKYLHKLEAAGYITRIWSGRRFSVHITDAGRYIACVSGLLESDAK
ncbi:HFX_2341 family transcriptional regulator domain-containing protein [Methanoculleus sp. 7T]|uniref:HFX_2341 family transcriptional regulator domain-containing protein n=1 Tax=Methanoculleus sp. 7T TaxID=2937282 RepID=UPI0020BFC6F3|nr:DUF6293 family protein [Methanoculleus sp. 7T]